MANTSIKAAFERMWQHIISTFVTRAEIAELEVSVDYTQLAFDTTELVTSNTIAELTEIVDEILS